GGGAWGTEVAAGKQGSGSRGCTSSRGSRRGRRSWTGGFAWRAASHVRMACDDLLSVSANRRVLTHAGSPKHLKMEALPSTPPKPGAGSPLLTGGHCQPAAATVAPDQSSRRRCRRLPGSAVILVAP